MAVECTLRGPYRGSVYEFTKKINEIYDLRKIIGEYNTIFTQIMRLFLRIYEEYKFNLQFTRIIKWHLQFTKIPIWAPL